MDLYYWIKICELELWNQIMIIVRIESTAIITKDKSSDFKINVKQHKNG